MAWVVPQIRWEQHISRSPHPRHRIPHPHRPRFDSGALLFPMQKPPEMKQTGPSIPKRLWVLRCGRERALTSPPEASTLQDQPAGYRLRFILPATPKWHRTCGLTCPFSGMQGLARSFRSAPSQLGPHRFLTALHAVHAPDMCFSAFLRPWAARV